MVVGPTSAEPQAVDVSLPALRLPAARDEPARPDLARGRRHAPPARARGVRRRRRPAELRGLAEGAAASRRARRAPASANVNAATLSRPGRP